MKEDSSEFSYTNIKSQQFFQSPIWFIFYLG